MSARAQTQAKQSKPVSFTPTLNSVLQRTCASCGNHTMGGGTCVECGKNKQFSLQTKLRVNDPGDVYEQEADRIAEQVMATPAHAEISGVTPRIQRFSGQSNGQVDAAPASVDQTLVSPGRPLETTLRQDMEQRFGYDFSRVRVHSGAVAEQSAQDVNAHAYTMGHDIVFDAGRFAPGTNEGQQLIAHELTHVVQQSAVMTGGISIQRDARPGDAATEDVVELSLGWEEAFLEVMNHNYSAEILAAEINDLLFRAGPERDSIGAALYTRLSSARPPADDRLAVKFNRTFKGKLRKSMLDHFKEVGRHHKPVRAVAPKLSTDLEKTLLEILNQNEDAETLAVEIEGALLNPDPEQAAALYSRLSPVDPPARDKLAVKFKRTFTGRIRQRLLDGFKRVGRHWDPIVPDPSPHFAPGVAPGRETKPVHQMGRIDAPEGVRLRQRPAIQGSGPLLPFDTLVSIDRKTIEEKGQQSWLYVVALGDDKEGRNATGVGFVEEYYVAQKPPEPTAHLYQVKPDDMLKDIAASHYKHGFNWGHDARVFVQAIYHANKDRDVVYRQNTDLTVDRRALETNSLSKALELWREARVVKGQALWMPSHEFVKRLKARGVIHHASISKKIWEDTIGAFQTLIDAAQYTAGFVVGLFQGAWDALFDLFTGVIDLIKAVWTVVKALFGDWDDLKAFAKKFEALWQNKEEILEAIATDFMKKWEKKDDYDRGNFQGEVVGYIMMTAFIMFVTMGAGAVIAGAGRLGNFIKVLQVLENASDITTYAGKLAKAANLSGKVVDKARDALKGRASSVRKLEAGQAPSVPDVDAPSAPQVDTPHAPKVDAKVVAKEDISGEAHHIQIRQNGGIELCSPNPCPLLEITYADILKNNKKLNKEMDDIKKLRRAADNPAYSQEVKQKLLKLAAKRAANLKKKLEATRNGKGLGAGAEAKSDEVAEEFREAGKKGTRNTEGELEELGGYQHAFEGPLGDIVSDPIEAGNLFNKVNVPKGAHAEVQLRTPSGRRPRVDLYIKGEAIISRKFPMGQLAQDEFKALGYLQELYIKYPPKAPIRSRALKGEVLEGIQVLQVPVQHLPIPDRALKYAKDRRIFIVDIEGKLYNL